MDVLAASFISLRIGKLYSYVEDKIIASADGKINYKQNSNVIGPIFVLKQASKRNEKQGFRKTRVNE